MLLYHHTWAFLLWEPSPGSLVFKACLLRFCRPQLGHHGRLCAFLLSASIPGDTSPTPKHFHGPVRVAALFISPAKIFSGCFCDIVCSISSFSDNPVSNFI